MPLFSGIYPQVAKNSGRNYLPPVLPAAALPFPFCWGGHGAEKSLSLLWPYWKMGGWRLLKLSLHQRHHTCLAYLHPGQSQHCHHCSINIRSMTWLLMSSPYFRSCFSEAHQCIQCCHSGTSSSHIHPGGCWFYWLGRCTVHGANYGEVYGICDTDKRGEGTLSKCSNIFSRVPY